MWKVSLLFACFVSATVIAEAQNVTLTLLEDLSSRLPSGTAFTAKDEAGKIYNGHVVTHPARRFLRRGSLIMVFDEAVVPVTKYNEGVFRAKNKMRLLKLGASLAAAKLADDSVDGVIGAAKARYVGAVVAVALIAFPRGGDVRLHRGDTFDVEPDRKALRDRSVGQPARIHDGPKEYAAK